MKAEIKRKVNYQQEQSSKSKKRGEKQKQEPYIIHSTNQMHSYLNLDTLQDFFDGSQDD